MSDLQLKNRKQHMTKDDTVDRKKKGCIFPYNPLKDVDIEIFAGSSALRPSVVPGS